MQVVKRMSVEDCEVLEYVASAPGSGECSGCAGQPFMTTGEVAAMMGGKSGNFLQCGLSFQAENGIPERLFSDRFSPPPSRLLYSIRSTPVTATDASVFIESVSPHEIAAAKDFPRTLLKKLQLMHHWACGLASLHANGYAHSNLSLKSLLISTKGNGFIGGMSLATAIPRGRDGGLTRSFTRDDRGVTAFRAPETYYRYRASDIMVTQCPEAIEENTFYAVGCQADVWALGIAFLMLLTESSVFKIHDARPYISLRGARRISLLVRSGAPRDKIERAIVTECVRWQSFLLFGRGNTFRKSNVRSMLGSGVKHGVIGAREADQFCELLTDMLNPSVSDRINAASTAAHSAFRMIPGWVSTVVTPGVFSASNDLRFKPRGKWTAAKDEAVQSALRAMLASPASAHLPAEVLFVAYDIAARAVSGINAPEPKELIQSVAIAAVRVGMLLYDTATSIAVGGDIYGEGSNVRALETYIVEYLSGTLKCDDYFARLVIKDGNVDLVKTAFDLVASDTPQSRAFRENYFEIDTVNFVKYISSGKSGIGSYTKSPTFPVTLHDLKLLATQR